MSTIHHLLTQHTIFIDGAMGTQLQQRGLHQDPAQLNLTAASDIIAIHREHLAAGADIITANTFGAYTHKHDNAAQLIKAAIAHGRAALEGQPNKFLALDLGPTGLMLEPYGDTTEEECYAIFKAAVDAGAPGSDLILIETMMDLTELKLAVTAAKEADLPIFATMTFDQNGRTMMGNSISDMVQLLEALEVTAIGMNCGFGPDAYIPLAQELKGQTKLPIVIQPNAGMPVTESDGSIRYDLTAQDFAAAVASMGVKIMGGCCGTSPAHIAALVGKF